MSRRGGRGDTRYLPEAARQKTDEETESLLVFGYHCKIFRDDEKAMFIEQKKHLIPWMGDSSLMIDRYDGRGHLYDLRAYDADLNKGKYEELTDEEKRVEALIDEERYLELHTDIAERAMYEEEELKRLNEEVGGSYGAVNFNYDYSSAEQTEQETQQTEEYEEEAKEEDSEGEEPFEPPDGLKVPHTMAVPTTVKQNAIIEKTAEFVSQHGAQMEIVIKTKQQNNPSFEFLQFHHVWNPYYKHVVRMIKSGLYKPQTEAKRKRTSSSSDDGKYLHPALSKKNTDVEEHVDSKKFLESVKAKLPSGQIANTLYSKLVSNLAKHTGRDSPVPGQRGANGEVNATQGPPNQPGDQYTGSARPHGYPPPPTGPPTSGTPGSYTTDGMYGPSYPGVPPPPGMEPVTLPSGSSAQPPPPGTQPPPPGTGPPDPLPYVDEPNTTESQASYNHPHQDPYYSSSSSSYDYHHQHHHHHHHHQHHHEQGAHSASTYSSDYVGYQHQEQEYGPQPYSGSGAETQPAQVEYGPQPAPAPAPAPGPALAPAPVSGPVNKTQQDPTQVEGPRIIPPPPDILPVIDKMASYVAKNGPAFEYVVKNKADGRFDFVHSWHQHNAYYEYRKRVYTEENEEEKRQKEAEEKQKPEDDDESSSLSGMSKAVTFTMKSKKKKQPTLKTRTALLYESSDEDEDSESGERRERVTDGEVSDSSSQAPGGAMTNTSVSVSLSGQASPTPSNSSERQSTEDNKAVEDKLKDKLAIAARDKLAAANKEKLIQAERKRKAAMFAAMLKSSQQDQQLQQQTAAQRAQAAVQAGGEDPAAGIQPPALKGAAIPPPLSLLSSSNTPGTSRSTSPAVSALKDSKSNTPVRSLRSMSPTEKFYKKRKSRSRSRSPKRKRSRSKDRSRRSRSRSSLKSSKRHKSRSRSRSPRKRRRSKSRSKSPRRHKRTKSPTVHRKSPSRRKRTRSRSGSQSKAKKKKSKRSRSRSRSRRSRSKSNSKSSKHKSPSKKKSKKKKKAKSRSRSPSSKAKPSSTVITNDDADDVIEIKSESGEEEGSSVQDDEETTSNAEQHSTAPQSALPPPDVETSDALVESSDQGEVEMEDRSSSAVESPAAAAATPSATVDSPRVTAPTTDSPRVAASRAKPVVDMFEVEPLEQNSSTSSPTSRSQNSGTVSPGGAVSKKNVSKEMLMKVRAMLKASRSSHEDT